MVEDTKTKICCYITIGRKPIVMSLSPSNAGNSYIWRHLRAHRWVETSISAHHKHWPECTQLSQMFGYSLSTDDGRVQFCRTRWYAPGLWHIRWILHWPGWGPLHDRLVLLTLPHSILCEGTFKVFTVRNANCVVARILVAADPFVSFYNVFYFKIQHIYMVSLCHLVNRGSRSRVCAMMCIWNL